MKKIILALMAFLMTFAFISCSDGNAQSKKISKNIVNISYLDSDDERTVYALDVFARKIDELSGSSVSVEYSVSENPVEDLMDGKSQIIITDTLSLGEYGENFKILTSPFFFLSPLQSTMLLNSDEFDDLYEDYFKTQLGCELLGTVYLDGEYIFSLSEAFTNFQNAGENSIFAVDGTDHVLMELLDANNIKCTSYERALEAYEEEQNLIYIDSVSMQKDFLKRKNKVYVSQYPYRINSQWVLVSSNYWNSIEKKEQDIIKQSLSFFNYAAEDERLDEYNNLYYTLSKNNINMVESDSAEMRNYCHTFVKYHSKTYENTDAALFNKTVNIIIS